MKTRMFFCYDSLLNQLGSLIVIRCYLNDVFLALWKKVTSAVAKIDKYGMPAYSPNRRQGSSGFKTVTGIVSFKDVIA
jgi:hypothetical protein